MFIERHRPTDPRLPKRPVPTRDGPTDRPSAARSAAKISGRDGPTDRPAASAAAKKKISRKRGRQPDDVASDDSDGDDDVEESESD